MQQQSLKKLFSIKVNVKVIYIGVIQKGVISWV